MQEVFCACTGRQDSTGHGFGETTVVAGARAGIAGPIVCYEAIFGGHEKNLAKGERAIIPLVAQDQRATNGSLRLYPGLPHRLQTSCVDGG